ncbi:MAG: T9SS type A sorting domain-containing protein [Saprospiraceae bacterium]|nr:T9SS type A sorting domain-containing protein [Saprospiraceae bacterium]
MKRIQTLLLALFVSGLAFGQFNPGKFEMQLDGGPNVTVMKMRAIDNILPTNNGNCFTSDQNTDLTWTVLYDPAVVSSVTAQTDLPCNFAGTGYFQGNAGAPVVFSPTEHLQGMNIVSSPIGFPETWPVNVWITICTLNVTTVVPPSQQSGASVPVISVVDFGQYGPQYYPNIGVNLVDYTPAIVPPLPLDLLDFRADKKGERSAILNWSTANEENTSHFEIERSTDLENWEMIGNVNAAGESTEVLRYSYLDENVYDGRRPNERFYYRLRMVDQDSRYKYSQIDVVLFSQAGNANGAAVFAFPNPSTKGLNVGFDITGDAVQPAEMSLINSIGQVVYHKEIPAGSELEYIDYIRANVGTGAYVLRVMDADQQIIDQIKIVVQETK